MGITHKWNGSVLTITSDSGTSSMDLRGPQGDDGVRGPQGQAGKDGSAAAIETDTTLSLSGKAADAKAAGDAISAVSSRVNNLTAADVHALPDSTIIPSTTGLATETFVNNALAVKQNKVYFNTSQPSGWNNGDIWLKPLS